MNLVNFFAILRQVVLKNRMRNRTLSPGLAALIVFAVSCPALGQEFVIDSGVREVVPPSGKKGKEFHCKISEDYGKKPPRHESLSKQTAEDLGEGPPPPPPP